MKQVFRNWSAAILWGLLPMVPARNLRRHLRHCSRLRRSVFSPSSVHPAKLVVWQDSEGSPYYFAEVNASDLCIHIAEGHTRAKCEEACESFNAAYHTSEVPDTRTETRGA